MPILFNYWDRFAQFLLEIGGRDNWGRSLCHSDHKAFNLILSLATNIDNIQSQG